MNKHKQITFASLLLPVLLAGCATTKENLPAAAAVSQPGSVMVEAKLPPLPAGAQYINGVAVVVNDELITFRDIIRESQPLILEAQKKGLIDDKTRQNIRLAVREQLIEKLLTQQKVKELNIKISAEEIKQNIDEVRRQNNNMSMSQLESALKAQGISFSQYENQIREQLERVTLIRAEVRARVHVTDKEAEEYYQANKARYAEEDQFRARHIFIKVDEKAPADKIQKAMDNALRILFEARQGKDFAELAKQYSDDTAAKKDGGDLGLFKRGEMLADLEKALLPLQPGEIGEIVSTPSGLHIVKLEERVHGKFKEFDSVKADIRELLYRKKQDERFAQWLKELRTKASIQIKDGTGIL